MRARSKPAVTGTKGKRRRTGKSQVAVIDEASLPAPELSEDALAETFSRRHAEDWRYVAAWGRWLGWTGAVWRADGTGRVVEVGSATVLVRELRQQGTRNKQGKPIEKGYLYRLLNNRVYLGEAVHKGTSYPGEHRAIVPRDLWDKVHAILAESPRKRAASTRAQTPALLKGLLFGPDGAAFSPTHTRKGDRLYRYYVSQAVLQRGREACPIGRVPAGEIEAAVIDQLRAVLRQPEIVAGTWKAAKRQDGAITEADAREALLQLDPLWDELFPAEQARVVQLLVERVDIGEDGLDIRIRAEGLAGLVREFSAKGREAA